MTKRLVFILFILSLAPAAFAQGVDPDFNFSYTLLPKGNQTFILPDETIAFPDATLNLSNPTLSQTNSATFVATNHATRAITVTNVAVSAGSAFTVSGLPILPVVLAINQSLTFTINFQPSQLGSAVATIHFDFALRTGVTFGLSGNGIGSVLVYNVSNVSTTRTVLANDTLTLPDTNIGDKTTITMTVRNTGNADAVISFLASSDPLFPLTNVPFLPFTLSSGNSISFNINFAPTQSGTFTARLRIGSDTFSLSGVGFGVTLTFTSVIGSASTDLGAAGAVIFKPTQVGSSSSAQMQISNTGNTAAFINSISVTGPATGVFTLPVLPALPVRIAGGSTVSFAVDFAPITVGQTTGSLKIDNRTFSLSGSGDAPEPLPGVSFTGSTAVVDAAQQIGVGITLDNPYPVQLDGKLTLTFAPTADVFSDDPAIAFASGGRTVNFIVPANSRTAVFGVGDNRIRFQTGTVAGTVTLSATFVTDAGGINLTTTTAPATNISVRPSAPRITSVQLSSRTATAITVLITGYSPTRSAQTMAFTFTPYVDPNNKDLQLDTTKLNLSVDGPFSVWYRGTASQAFGSLFTATVTFSVFGNIDAIQSLAVTMSNSLGASNSSSVSLR
jgi:hypothetical protein